MSFRKKLQDSRFWLFFLRCFFPEPNSAQKCVGVVAGPTAVRQLFLVLDPATTEHDVVGMNPLNEERDNLVHMLPPFFFAQPFARVDSNIVFKSSALFVLEVRNFSRFSNAVDDNCSSQPGSKPEKQHLPALITSESLHSCIVDKLH